ncbi:MAG: FAD-dependent oxidoreductase [Armatimonadota bacterium]
MTTPSPIPPLLLMEAEQFAAYGGWVLDQQSMDQMGSPYLLAHGLGRPVEDAVTTMNVPTAGTYRVWVRTRDWVAPWGFPDAPGRFQVLVNGHPLATTFGTAGADWAWHDGGLLELPAGQTTLALHDLTGFEGRCDALLFCADTAFIPPNDPDALRCFRRRTLALPDQPQEGGDFDLVVVGGGIAGMCAAVTAARLGLRVALVHDRPALGGNNSYEVCVNLAGETNLPPYPHLGNIVREFEPSLRLLRGHDSTAPADEDPRLAQVANEERLTLLAGYRVVGVEMAGTTVNAVIAQDIVSGQQLRVTGRWVADCTGDGDVGYLAGADYDITLTGHLGPSNLWRTLDTGAPAPFPSCPWALDLRDKPFPGRGDYTAQWAKPGLASLGHWFWESGFDLDPIADQERIRDWNFLAMYGAWDTLKNVDGLYPTHQLSWAGYVAGKRESRRLFGDVVVTRGDLFRQRAYPDACVPCTWHMDLHVPHHDYQHGFEGDEFISWCVEGPFPAPFWLPYRALYSRNITNLFMAGRDISVTHEALGAVRVMRTGGMMGEVVGIAAALCQRLATTPRGIYTDHLEALQALLRQGVPAAVTTG